MPTHKNKTQILFRRGLAGLLVGFLCAGGFGAYAVSQASAATSSAINFQARLMNSSGNVVPDGNYNVEFKLYDAASSSGSPQGSCTGDSSCLWVEERTGGNVVRVVNGYLTVNLGSISSFSSSINWSQELWLTMNIGGTGAPSWDGEMSPRLKLTAVPYAFRANVLGGGTGADVTTLDAGTPSGSNTLHLPAETGTLCVRESASCGFVTGSVADFIQNQGATDQTADFRISGTGRAVTLQAATFDTATAAALGIGTTNATAVNLNQNTVIAAGKTLTVEGGTTSLIGASSGDALTISNSTSTGNILTLKDDSTDVVTVIDGGAVLFKNVTDSAAAFQVQNSAATPLFTVDTLGSRALVSSMLAGSQGFEGVTFPPASPGVWTTGGDAPWSRTSSQFQEGTASAASGNIGDSQFSYLDLDYTFSSNGTLKFLWKVDNGSEEGFDFLYLCVDNDTCDSPGYSAISGNVDWTEVTVPVTAGAHSFRWIYSKDGCCGDGQDEGWVDNVQIYEGGNFLADGNIISLGRVGVGTQSPGSALHVVGGALLQGVSSDPAALQVNNTNGDSLLRVSNEFSEVRIGNYLSDDGTAVLFVLDTKDTAGDPSMQISNGAMYYNSSLGKFRCYEDGWKNCIASAGFTQGGDAFGELAVLGTTDAFGLQLITDNTVRATFGTNDALYLGNGVTAAAPNNFTISGTGSSVTGVAGGSIILQGGNATVGNANGGNVTISGGLGSGSGVSGLVVIDTPTITTSSTQNCASNCEITQANIDSSGVVLINATSSGLTVTLPDPTLVTAGRIMYVTNVGVNDFTLSVNGGGTGNTIAMKPSTTATMIWNGSDWTAAGASSSTDLQSAYNNTLTSAGGAELVLNAPGGSADGLTIRNNGTTPIVGGILEVQTSIGSNLLSVNNNATEYATNGGAETAGVSSSTFPSNTWDITTGGALDRWTTAGDNVATGQASVRVQTSAINHGARNLLSTSLTSGLTYTVSFAVRGAVDFNSLQVLYSADGTTTETTQCATAQTVTSGIWSRVTCSFVAAGTITSSNSILIRQTDSTGRTFYIDNLSININASATFAADGSVDDAGSFAANWSDFDAGTGSTVISRETTVIYDTSASTAGATTANTSQGIRNNMPITPSTNTQYLVSFYARSTSTMTNSLSVGFLPAGGTNVPSGTAACVDYSSQSLTANTWTKITCLFTTTAVSITDPDLVIYQTDSIARTIYVDALSITLNTNNSNNVQVGGANRGGPTTLFTLDRSSGAPIAANNEAYLGSMYYDTTTGRIQCYEADGWGACGAPPDNVVNLNPEYAGAVLNGTGIGTMSADFCSNDTALNINSSLCATGQAKNYYEWTSPQATLQTYSIYVTYQLPATFNGFASDDTVQLVARADSTSDAAVTYEMFKSTGSTVTQCGSGETTVVTSTNTWQSVGISGNEATGCGFGSSSAGNFIIFKINVKARNNANAYISTLSFTTTGR